MFIFLYVFHFIHFPLISDTMTRKDLFLSGGTIRLEKTGGTGVPGQGQAWREEREMWVQVPEQVDSRPAEQSICWSPARKWLVASYLNRAPSQISYVTLGSTQPHWARMKSLDFILSILGSQGEILSREETWCEFCLEKSPRLHGGPWVERRKDGSGENS